MSTTAKGKASPRKPLTEEEQAEQPWRSLVLFDIIDEAFNHSTRRASWVRECREEAEILIREKQTPRASVVVFWLRLHAVLTEIRDWAREAQASDWDEYPADGPLIPATDRIVEAIDALTQGFTVNELFYIEYRRHSHAHVSLRGFTHAPNKGGDVRVTYTPAITKAEVMRKEIQDGVKEVLDRHGSEAEAAVALATKSVAYLNEIEAGLEVWNSI